MATRSLKPQARKAKISATSSRGAEFRDVMIETYAANDRMNQLLLENIDPRAWRADPPRASPRDGRTVAMIFAHLHNNRLSWIRNSAPHLKVPAPLDPARCTIKQAQAAHRQSAKQCLAMLTDALSEDPARRVAKYSRGSWSQTWPAGASMFAYMFAHEAHHRGQVIMLTHQLGFRLPVHAAYGVWHWEKLWKQLGSNTRPR
jgi:uncharacterized damage-inducible protein DinB